MAGRGKVRHFPMGAETKSLRKTEPGQRVWVEVTPGRDVGVVSQNPRLVRPLQRVELVRVFVKRIVERLKSFVELEA